MQLVVFDIFVKFTIILTKSSCIKYKYKSKTMVQSSPRHSLQIPITIFYLEILKKKNFWKFCSSHSLLVLDLNNPSEMEITYLM